MEQELETLTVYLEKLETQSDNLKSFIEETIKDTFKLEFYVDVKVERNYKLRFFGEDEKLKGTLSSKQEEIEQVQVRLEKTRRDAEVENEKLRK